MAVLLTPEEQRGIELLVNIMARPAIPMKADGFSPPTPWEGLIDQRREILQVARSVGRIGLEGQTGLSYSGTGFVVADGVVMTNRHVAEEYSAKGAKGWKFRPKISAGIDYGSVPDGKGGSYLGFEGIIAVHPKHDLALLKLKDSFATGEPSPPH